jgi:hypothetical protein
MAGTAHIHGMDSMGATFALLPYHFFEGRCHVHTSTGVGRHNIPEPVTLSTATPLRGAY